MNRLPNDVPREPELPELILNPRVSISSRLRAKIRMGRNKLEKEKIKGTKNISKEALLRFMIFNDRKKALTIIQKDALFHTLRELKIRVSKSSCLSKLIDELAKVYSYDELKEKVIHNISIFQKKIKDVRKNELKHIIGPGNVVSKCINSECPYTLEPLEDISHEELITWQQPYRTGKIYGCNAVCLFEYIMENVKNPRERFGEMHNSENVRDFVFNPFTREHLTVDIVLRCFRYGELKGLVKIEKPKPIHPYTPIRREFRNNIDLQSTNPRRLARPRVTRTSSVFNNVPLNILRTNDRIPPPLWGQHFRLRIPFIEKLEQVSDLVSESFRDLGFYTHETVMRDLMGNISEINRDSISASVSLNHEDIIRYNTQLADIIEDIVQPFVRIFTILLGIGEISRRIRLSQDEHIRLARGYFNRHISRDYRSLPHTTDTLNSRISYILNVLYARSNYIIMMNRYLLDILYTVLVKDKDEIPEEDRRSFVIGIFGALRSCGILGDDYEWATFIF